LIASIIKNESDIVIAINQNRGFENLEPILQVNSGTVKSYLQLNSLYNKKMLIDERILLANINEFLLKKQNGDSRSRNGSITKILIWEPSLVSQNLYQVPLQLSATFNNKDGLLSFIDNIENKVLPDPDYRVLYHIDEIVYDIVNYEEKQNVDILLSAYYYQTELSSWA